MFVSLCLRWPPSFTELIGSQRLCYVIAFCLSSSATLNSQYGVRSRADSFLFENDNIETKMLTKEARIRRNINVDPEVMLRVGQLG